MLVCMCAKSLQLCPTLCDPVNVATRILCPWDSPGKNTGVGCHALLQWIFLTEGWNLHLLGLLYWQVGSLPLAPTGKKPLNVGTLSQSSTRLSPDTGAVCLHVLGQNLSLSEMGVGFGTQMWYLLYTSNNNAPFCGYLSDISNHKSFVEGFSANMIDSSDLCPSLPQLGNEYSINSFF